MSAWRPCPTCGGSGVVVRDDDPTRPDDQTLSDRDQTASDADQTWADRDQTASDRDRESSSEDQRASDDGLAAGGDPAVHERTRLARERAARDRDEISSLRDVSAATRLLNADERDRRAASRDREAAERDRLAEAYDLSPGRELAEIRLEAARNRALAAADRARAAADREAAAVERAEARRLQNEAEIEIAAAATDELTGAWTRAFGLGQIMREIERAERTGGSLALAFVDVDGLKEVNDTRGHVAGDELLTFAAATLAAALRSYDVIVRYGGDEFLCAMPDVSRAAAVERLNAVAASMAASETGHSITFGLAEHRPGDVLAELIARADADLLAARQARNKRG